LTFATSSDLAPLLIGERTITGQNIAMVADTGQTNFGIANYFQTFWQDNAGDNLNMLNSDYLEVGVGIVKWKHLVGNASLMA